MTDKELLEFAAKAAGLKKDDSPYNGGGHGNDGFSITGAMMLDWAKNKQWNPLANDGDALWLAVKVGLDVWIDQDCCEVFFGRNLGGNLMASEIFGAGDRHAATRRAIVRAAAKIGKAMK